MALYRPICFFRERRRQPQNPNRALSLVGVLDTAPRHTGLRDSPPQTRNTTLLLDGVQESKVFLLQFTRATVANLPEQCPIRLRKPKINARQLSVGAEHLSERLLRDIAIKAGTELLCSAG